VGRAVVGLPLILALQFSWFAAAWWFLLLAGLSDAADGWLARLAGGGSSWGARLDPLTDKVLIAAPLLWLASTDALPVWAVWLLLARELLISGWRAEASDGAPASGAGKAKTILQFISLLLLLWPPTWFGYRQLVLIGWWMFWPSLLLALTSAVGYLKPQSALHRN
tara:strand:- start:4000 stop:4497 length:498 start_codon:yes stop_codon:yes gene_type:complete